MKASVRIIFTAAVGLALIGGVRSDEPAPKAEKSPAFEAMKKLVGDWVAVGEDGKPTSQVVSSFKLISNGTVLVETLFPGTGHEMATVYHMDGPDFVCTHYCALGNQPRLKLEAGKDAKVLEFKSVSVGNSKSMNDMHMGHARIMFKDDDHYHVDWQALVNQKPAAGHAMSMDLVRKAK